MVRKKKAPESFWEASLVANSQAVVFVYGT